MKRSSKIWSLQDAKARFSELVRRAQTAGPQTVTLHGKPIVTVRSIEAEERLSGLSAADVLRSLSFGEPVDFEIPDWETGADFRDVSLP